MGNLSAGVELSKLDSRFPERVFEAVYDTSIPRCLRVRTRLLQASDRHSFPRNGVGLLRSKLDDRGVFAFPLAAFTEGDDARKLSRRSQHPMFDIIQTDKVELLHWIVEQLSQQKSGRITVSFPTTRSGI